MNEQITLYFELDDIDGLHHTSTRSFYFEQPDRFEDMGDTPKDFIQDKGLYMYWIDGYASVLLFTKILNSFGYKTHIINDLIKEEVNEYVVLTDYMGSWSQWDKEEKDDEYNL